MRIAIVTASLGDIDTSNNIITQLFEDKSVCHVYSYNDNNLPFPLPGLSNRLKSKYLKIKMHEFLPNYDYYVWVDGRIDIKSETLVKDFVNMMESLRIDFSGMLHETRKTVFEEINYILENINSKYLFERYGDQQMEKELEFFNENKKRLESVQLLASGFFVRSNSSKVNRAFDEWWDKVIQYSCFDQAMLCYILAEYAIISCQFNTWETMFTDYLDIGKHNTNPINLSYKDALYRIKKHLIYGMPLALIRYGDGEAMLLDDNKEDSDFVFNRQLGKGVSEDHKQEIKNNLIEAYKKADIIGRPTSRHSNRQDHWGKANEILSRYISLKKDSCSIDTFYDCLNNNDLNQSGFDELLMNRETLFYINSNNLDEVLKQKYNIKNIKSFIIAPEMKFSPDYNGDVHYPTQFNQIKEWIGNLNCENDLCLVGAGAIGKIYNIWFKEKGGISLDIGGVFDLWAGKNTRGPGRGPGAIDNTYKL